MTQIKRSGKGTVQHKEVISDADIAKLDSSDAVSVDNPQRLKSKVFLDVKLYTCRRGRENLRNMKKSDFIVKTDARGRCFYANVAKYETKNHRGSDVADDDMSFGRIYEMPGIFLLNKIKNSSKFTGFFVLLGNTMNTATKT